MYNWFLDLVSEEEPALAHHWRKERVNREREGGTEGAQVGSWMEGWVAD